MCRNPDCKKEFEATFHTQLYCCHECRGSYKKDYIEKINVHYIPPFINEPTKNRVYTCYKCGSKMLLRYTDKGDKLYLICSKPKCRNKIDYDRYLKEGRLEKDVRKSELKK